jgi:hypothetical protein
MIWPHWKTAENPHVSPILLHILVIEVKKMPTGIDSYNLVKSEGLCSHPPLPLYEVVFLIAMQH